MSFHQDRGGPRGGIPPGQHGSPQNYRPTNLRPAPPQPPAPPYPYDPQTPPQSSCYHGNSSYMPQHSDFMPYPHPPPQSQAPNSVNQCPVRPPYPKPPVRQGFPEPPPNFPPPPLPTGGSTSGSQVSAQNAYHTYMMPPVPPPPLPHPSMPPPMASQSVGYHPPYSMNYPHPPHPPFPPPTFNPGYTHSPNSFKPDIRHLGQYKYDKPLDNRRSPDRGYRHDDHRQKSYGYSGHGDRNKMEFSVERKDRGRSPDRRGRSEGGRYRTEYDRGRTPPRHRSRERSRYMDGNVHACCEILGAVFSKPTANHCQGGKILTAILLFCWVLTLCMCGCLSLSLFFSLSVFFLSLSAWTLNCLLNKLLPYFCGHT